jgi:hypothetical protein
MMPRGERVRCVRWCTSRSCNAATLRVATVRVATVRVATVRVATVRAATVRAATAPTDRAALQRQVNFTYRHELVYHIVSWGAPLVCAQTNNQTNKQTNPAAGANTQTTEPCESPTSPCATLACGDA